MPLFIKPGKQDFIFRSPKDKAIAAAIEEGEFVDMMDYQIEDDVAFQFFYARRIVPVREEIIPFFAKKLNINDLNHIFHKPSSMFKDWQEDTPQILSNAYEHDK